MSDSTFNFPAGLDDFEPTLINDITPVNANHILDLRQAILELERVVLGPTSLTYLDTSIIADNDSIRSALQKLDYYTTLLGEEIGLITDGYFDGYSSRLETIEGELEAHREAVGGLDSYGFSVHGAEGAIVGTLNQQTIYKKILDSTNEVVGTKIILRAHPSETTGRQFEVYDYLGSLKSWIDGNGNARFKDLTIDGYTIQAGVDLVENSLKVDGYSILGRADSPTDYLLVNGPSTFNGSLTLNGDLVLDSANATLAADNSLTITTPDSYFVGSLSVSNGLSVEGPIALGKIGSTDTIVIRTSVSQSLGYFYVGGFRADGGKFRVENDTTQIKSSSLIIESSSIQLSGTTANFVGNGFSIDGYQIVLGKASTSSTNTIDVNGDLLVDGNLAITGNQLLTGTVVIGENLQVDSGTGSFQNLESDSLKLNQTTEKRFIPVSNQDGYLTLTRPKYYQTLVVDSYSAYREDAMESHLTAGFYEASPYEEILANTLYASVTIYLPENPLLGDRIKVRDYAGSFSSTNKVVISQPGTTLIISKSFTNIDFNITTNEVNWSAHGLSDNQKIGNIKSDGDLPIGLKFNSFLYAKFIDLNTIKFQDSPNGNIVEFGSLPSGSPNYTLRLNTIDGNSSLDLTTPNQTLELLFDGANWRSI